MPRPLVVAVFALVVVAATRAPRSPTRGADVGPGAAVQATVADTPTLVAPGVISTPDNERGATFTPDGDTMYFTKRTADPYFSLICVSVRARGQWTTPRVAEFSGRYNDSDPAVSPDGRTLVFVSTRPAAGAGTTAEPAPHLWMVRRAPGGAWGPPERLGEPVNSTTIELSPSFGPDASLYFSSGRTGGAGSLDLYVAKADGDRFGAPTSLGASNSTAPELFPAVSPDGSLLIFASVGRPDEFVGAGAGYGRGDLYASRWLGDHWGPGIHLPRPINTAAGECCASFSRDGETLYFTSERGFATETFARPITLDSLTAGLRSITNGLGNLYAIPTRAVRALVNQADTTRGSH